MLRLVHHFNETSTEVVPLRYVDLGPGGSLVVRNYYLYLFETEVPVPVDYNFGSALLQNQEVRAGSRGNWGNVKIPRIERLDESSAYDDGWLPVPNYNRTAETYSSLMGIPIVRVPRQGTTNMSCKFQAGRPTPASPELDSKPRLLSFDCCSGVVVSLSVV